MVWNTREQQIEIKCEIDYFLHEEEHQKNGYYNTARKETKQKL